MIPWELLDTASVPKSRSEIHLYRRGHELAIRIDRDELMNSQLHGSEEALARIPCERVSERENPRVLIGGLGMGFTLAAALRTLGPKCEVVVAELIPAVVKWNRGPLADLAERPLEDPRVEVYEGDVAELLRNSRGGFDAVILDVDNGPEGMTRCENDWIYGRGGLRASLKALRKQGLLSVWSASPDVPFTKRLKEVGYIVEDLRVPAGPKGRGQHTVWIATKRN